MAIQNKNSKTPEDYEALRAAIVENHDNLSRQLKKIAQFVLDHPHDVAMNTVARIAQHAEVQPSALVRFAQSLGFDGFSDMQQVLRSHLMLNLTSYRDRIETLGPIAGDGAEGQSPLEEFVSGGIAALERLRTAIPKETLERAVDILARSEEIYLVAQGRSFPVAFYIAFALGRLEKRCYLLDNVGGLLRQQAELATARDAILAISFRPYTPLVIDIVTGLNEKGVPIVAITDSPVSPLAQEAAVSLEIQDNGERVFRSLIAPMCLAQALVVSLGNTLAPENGGAGAGENP